MISRRAFLTTSAAAMLSAPVRAARRRNQRRPAIDAARLRARLERLSTFGRPQGGTFASGVSRVAYSDADVAARTWLADEIRSAGLTPRIDPAGNIFAQWTPNGTGADRPGLLFGSHIDSVPVGGNFDGDLGTLAALEVIQASRTAGVVPRQPWEIVIWAHEESTAFGRGTAGSRVVAGDLQAGDLAQTWNGLTRADCIRRIGGQPDRIEDAVRQTGHWRAYVELHIEQGGTLEKSGTSIGVVDGIVAIRRYDVTVTGFANHAGTTPMGERQDALVAASELVLAVRATATSRSGRHVGTVGRLDVSPNSPNVIPGRVTLSIEFRDLSEAVLAQLFAEIQARGRLIAEQTRTDITMALGSRNPPALTDTGVQKAIERAAERQALSSRHLPSGAGHDAQMMAALCPMGMIFVPSVGGISHSPQELTTWEDCARGAAVLADVILELDSSDTIA